MRTNQRQDAPQSQCLNLKEVAARLAIGYQAAWFMVRRGQLVGAFRIGREWKVPEDALKTFVASRAAKEGT